MKNTIEILAEGENHIPTGTVVTRIKNGTVLEVYKSIADGTLYITKTTECIYQVDFKDIEPLYPHKGMKVPSEGIEFTDGKSRLIDVGENGITIRTNVGVCEFLTWPFITKNHHYELKRALPKTVTVCAECFKEACECQREEGWYRVLSLNNKYYLRYWDGQKMLTHKDGREVGAYKSVCGETPIKETPEGER